MLCSWPLTSWVLLSYCVEPAEHCQRQERIVLTSVVIQMCVRLCVCLSCTMLPRHQVRTGICHTGSAQRHSPHYPLWTRTDVISLSVSLPPITLSPSPPFPLSLSHSCISFLSFLFLPFCLPESSSIFVLSWFFHFFLLLVLLSPLTLSLSFFFTLSHCLG